MRLFDEAAAPSVRVKETVAVSQSSEKVTYQNIYIMSRYIYFNKFFIEYIQKNFLNYIKVDNQIKNKNGMS